MHDFTFALLGVFDTIYFTDMHLSTIRFWQPGVSESGCMSRQAAHPVAGGDGGGGEAQNLATIIPCPYRFLGVEGQSERLDGGCRINPKDR